MKNNLCALFLILMSQNFLHSVESPEPKEMAITQSNEEIDTANQNDPRFRVILGAYYRTSLSPVILRPVKYINFRMGDRFRQGDVLIQLDSVSLTAARDKAKAVLAKAASEFDAKSQLYNRDLSSHFEYNEAKAALEAAKAELIIAEDSLAKGLLVAPFNGKVVDLMIEENEYPKENTPIVEIIDDHIIRAKFLLPAKYFKYVRIGAPVEINVIGLGKVKGVITRTGSIIDPSSSTIKIEAEIENPNGELIPGMIGLITLESLKRGSQ